MATYTPSLALQAALKRIMKPPNIINKKGEIIARNYEHHVATWACTKLYEIFPKSGEWTITPEQKDTFSGKKPDIIVEKISQEDWDISMKLYLCMELKKEKGDRFEDALNQLVTSIIGTVDSNQTFEVYAVVQVGRKIAFFEYHSDESNLDEEGIPHFRGCISLTQSYHIQGKETSIIKDLPAGVEKLFFNAERLQKDTELRREAERYHYPCVFDIEMHSEVVHDLFCHMMNNAPRSSV